jgi:hypothetical protein
MEIHVLRDDFAVAACAIPTKHQAHLTIGDEDLCPGIVSALQSNVHSRQPTVRQSADGGDHP